MRSRAAAGAQVSVSLFPFLAVLICTMGVLLLLLVIAVHVADQTEAASTSSAQAAAAEALAEHQSNLELSQLKTSAVLASRQQLQQELEQARARRGHVEHDLSDLEQRYSDLQRRFQEAANPQALDAELLAADSTRIEQEIDQANQTLAALKAEAQTRPKMYSIVPHQSIRGTNRRPIYVECLPDRIIFRPGDLAIPASELEPPTLPGNPLDVALQAVRTYWVNLKLQGEAGTPYPLLVVRPGGSRTYALARRAMQNWDDEFGYELIEEEKQLDFGEADVALEAHLRQTLATARAQYAVLREAALAQHARVEAQQAGGFGGGLQASPQGGFVVSGTRQPAGRVRPGDAASGRDGPRGAATGDLLGTAREPSGISGDRGNRSDNESGLKSPQARTGAGTDRAPSDRNGSAGKGAGEDPSAHDHSGATTSASEQPPSGASPLPTGQETLAQLQTSRTPPSEPAADGESNAGGRSNGQQGTRGAAGGAATASASAAPYALAESRGANWAVPAYQPNATAYRRLVTVECTAEGLWLEPAVRGGARQIIPYEPNPADTADQLVSTLWNRIKGWGIAERNGYWLPELRFVVHDASRAQFDQLRAVLAGSGLELQEAGR